MFLKYLRKERIETYQIRFVKAIPGEAGRSRSRRCMAAASVVFGTTPPVDGCLLCLGGLPVRLILRGRAVGFSSGEAMDEMEEHEE